jgi:hypothetical protein
LKAFISVGTGENVFVSVASEAVKMRMNAFRRLRTPSLTKRQGRHRMCY